MFWSSGTERDRHLIRGQTSPDLRAAIAFTSAAGNQFARDYLSTNLDVSLTFTPLFRGVPNGNLLEAFGIHFNTDTGVCRIDAAAPATVKPNFIVEVVAQNPDGTTFQEVIRFHIHGSVRRSWMTPARLTVRPSGAARPEATDYRFTVIAEFDDLTAGDITLNHGVTWLPAGNFPTANEGKLTLVAANATGSDIDVRARYPTPTGSIDCHGTVHVAPAWADEPNLPRATIVPGGGWPGTIRPEAVPNVLFLGDGFTSSDADRTAFESMTNSFVHHMKTNRLMRPFDLLATSINFWRTFVPGSSGISVRGEVYTWTVDGVLNARSIPMPEKPVAGTPWTLLNAIYAIGLPLQGDRTRPNAALRAEWTVLLAPDPGPNLEDDLIDLWKLAGDRMFIDEVDAFPGMSYGGPPAVRDSFTYILDLHEGRGGVRALKSLYRVLTSDSGVALDGGVPLGHLWDVADPDVQKVHFDNTDLVAILSSIPGGRAQNGTGYIAISSETQDLAFQVTRDPTRRALQMIVPATPPDVSVDSCRVMTHELAHSFGVDDEYADFITPFADQDSLLPEAGNLQTAKHLKNAAGDFDGALIKWNWHRITKAGLVVGPITGPAIGPFTIPVKLGDGLQFADRDKVLLRLRQWRAPLSATPDVLSNAQELQVVSRTTNGLVVEPVTAGGVTIADLQRFLPGSIVFIPTPPPTSVRSAAYPYAEIVALNVKTEITAHNRPLWAHPAGDLTTGPEIQMPNVDNIVLRTLWLAFSPRIIGLYEGGGLHAHDIFHPAGSCMMRDDHTDSAQFCHVCRYVMVDLINPSRHFEIDRDYERFYAQG